MALLKSLADLNAFKVTAPPNKAPRAPTPAVTMEAVRELCRGRGTPAPPRLIRRPMA